MSVLTQICTDKKDHIARQKAQTPLADLQSRIRDVPPPRGFIHSLAQAHQNGRTALIAEVKKASPSKGVIRDDFDPSAIARIYADGGATCLSVLTDEPYFQGHDDFLKAVKDAVTLPVLRKDFMLDPYQIYESRALGADCILLIMAALTDPQAQEFYTLSKELGMDVLVEIHDAEELDRALTLSPEMIGVNNRNLKTLDVDLQTGLTLAAQIPDTVLKVAESGISDPQEIERFQKAGYRAFLVGESLMRQDNIAQALKNLLQDNL